jgi:hypothetical protein
MRRSDIDHSEAMTASMAARDVLEGKIVSYTLIWGPVRVELPADAKHKASEELIKSVD